MSIVPTGPVVLAVLLILAGMSIVTWAFLIYKVGERKWISRHDRKFLAGFYQLRKMEEIEKVARKYPFSGAGRLFLSVYEEYERQKNYPPPAPLPPETLTRIMERTMEKTLEEIRMERSRFHTFFATTASSGPFIGLFGTVWGIMEAFAGIGKSGSATLSVVAPAISEALIATATGLFAAIPATIIYNYLESQVEKEISRLRNFRMELLNLLEAYLFPGKTTPYGSRNEPISPIIGD